MSDHLEPSPAPNRPRRVCIVDDDPGIRESLRFLFEDAGYAVEEAEDGASALALLRADERASVVLLDRMMARVDGVQTLRLLNAEPDLARRTAIIYMTARNDPPAPEMAELIRRSTFATVSKPFNLDALLEMVERASMQLAEREARA